MSVQKVGPEYFLPIEDDKLKAEALGQFIAELCELPPEDTDEQVESMEEFAQRLYKIIIYENEDGVPSGQNFQRYYRPPYSAVFSIAFENVKAEEGLLLDRSQWGLQLTEAEKRLLKIGACITAHLEHAIVPGFTPVVGDFWEKVPPHTLQRLLKSTHYLHNNIATEKSKYIYGITPSEDMQTQIDDLQEEIARLLDVLRKMRILTTQASAKAESSANDVNATLELIEETSQKVGDVQKKIEDTQKNVEDAQKDVKKAQENADATLKQAQKAARSARAVRSDNVTILSIFATIIVMVTGGIAIIGNAVTALQYVNAAKATAIALTCIFGFFNSLAVLLFIVSRITDKSLAVFCHNSQYKDGCTGDGCEGCTKKCHVFLRVVRRLPYLFWLDFILISGIVVTASVSCFLTLTGGKFAADHVDLVRNIFYSSKFVPPLFW